MSGTLVVDFELLQRRVLRPEPSLRTEAEACVREYVSRLPPFVAPAEVRWREGALAERVAGDALSGLLLAVHENAPTTEWDTEPAWRLHDGVPRRAWPERLACGDALALSRLHRDISAAELWHSAALNGYQLHGWPRPVAACLNPFEPLFAVWATGYALDSLQPPTLLDPG